MLDNCKFNFSRKISKKNLPFFLFPLMFSKLIFFVLCIATYSLPSPTTLPIITNDYHDSHLQKRARNPSNIAIEDLEVIASVKETILDYTFETDKIIFVGNTPSYIYYSFKPSNNRQVQLIPYSGRWMYEFFNFSRKTAKSIVKKYCEDFIDPLGIHGKERLVLVDFSMTGDGVFQVKKSKHPFLLFFFFSLKNY